jgi:hypothetical protein
MDSGVDGAYYSGKHKAQGVNVQVIADPAGRLIWISPALPEPVTIWAQPPNTGSSMGWTQRASPRWGLGVLHHRRARVCAAAVAVQEPSSDKGAFLPLWAGMEVVSTIQPLMIVSA